MFQRILVANRGEIASTRDPRLQGARHRGCGGLFPSGPRRSPTSRRLTVQSASARAYSADSYLNRSRIIAAAEVADAQAIHPGYGFLSENPDFAEVCRSSGFEFIGPSHEAIRKMGLKTEAKRLAAASQVACVPGSDGAITSDAQAARLALQIGYPVLIKAAAGGGGKGMRVCRGESSLTSALQAARNEAEAAFKNASIYLEKFIDRPRHVEVQILADRQGGLSTVGTAIVRCKGGIRNWSRNRPAPTLPIEVRQRLGEAAVRLARAAGYTNAGTCEFLVDSDNNFYFIEVNARIQVEHPVTEMVTGIDLVKRTDSDRRRRVAAFRRTKS